jgi:hypothetical protein
MYVNLFECEVCGNTDPQSHEELVSHILSTHLEYTDQEAEYYSNLWEENKQEELDAQVYEREDPSDRDPLP